MKQTPAAAPQSASVTPTRGAVCPLCETPVSAGRVRWVIDGFAIAQCPACSLLFRADLPGTEDVAAIYGEEYFRAEAGDAGLDGYRNYLADAEQHRLTARRRLDRLDRHVQPGRLLDVGCAAGFFMDEARDRGWTVTGIDVAPAMTKYTRDVLALDVHTALVQEVELEEEAYDCVTMWDYIEHSHTPLDDLGRAYRALRPGGLIALSTGDSNALVARLSGRRWHLLTPRHHNFFFSQATLERALRQSGFEIRAVGRPPAWYSLRYLAHKLRAAVPLRVIGAMSDWIGHRSAGALAVPLNFWDIVTVMAQRPPRTVVSGRPLAS